MADVVSEGIRLNNDIARLAERAGASVADNINRVRKANNYLNGLYKNSWIESIQGADALGPLYRYGSDLGARYAWLGITSSLYLSRAGFKQILDYINKLPSHSGAKAMAELMHDPYKCLESLEPIIERVDSEGFASFIELRGDNIRLYCGKFREAYSVYTFLGMIVNEMVLNDQPPEAIKYPITALSAEITANLISWRDRSSRLGFQLVEGNLGLGKSTYVFMSILGAIRLLMGAPPVGWETRIAPLMYMRSINDLIDVLEYFNDPYNKDLYIPLLVIEDASSTLPKYWAWEGRETIKKMKRVHELLINLRSRFANLIMIANSINSLASFARELMHIRYSAISMDVGMARHTVFVHNTKGRNPFLWGWRSLKLMGSVVYPLNKLPREVYEADLAYKRGRMRQIAGELKAGRTQGGDGE